ncbi:hypothetical protein CFS9_04160 [Flavobacterium sp. CFS9]|uniref:Uncharacterized protein n=1 Tax=Flavobacterium sp. CFS9 TaxID=3143118 RepID=A0AAT9GX15_9FLAO
MAGNGFGKDIRKFQDFKIPNSKNHLTSVGTTIINYGKRYFQTSSRPKTAKTPIKLYTVY